MPPVWGLGLPGSSNAALLTCRCECRPQGHNGHTRSYVQTTWPRLRRYNGRPPRQADRRHHWHVLLRSEPWQDMDIQLDNEMIAKLQVATGIRTVNKKLCAGLRSTLEEVGKVLADGAREICHIRHTITALHAEERLRMANHITTEKRHQMTKGRQPTLNLWLRTGILAEKR